jgi:hypothetical protein
MGNKTTDTWRAPIGTNKLDNEEPVSERIRIHVGDLRACIEEFLEQGKKKNAMSVEITRAMLLSVKEAISEEEFRKWAGKNKHREIPHTFIDTVLKTPFSTKEVDYRLAYAVHQLYGRDITVDRLFGPKFIGDSSPFSLAFEARNVSNTSGGPQRYKVAPNPLEISQQAVSISYPDETDPKKTLSFTIRLSFPNARIGVRYQSGKVPNPDDQESEDRFEYHLPHMSSPDLRVALDSGLRGDEVIALNLAPGGESVDFHACIMRLPIQPPLLEWFTITVTQNTDITWTLTAPLGQVRAVPADKAETDQDKLIALTRAALVTEHWRGSGLREQDFPLARAISRLAGPAVDAVEDVEDYPDGEAQAGGENGDV